MTLSASPTSIGPGGSFTLSWSSTGASACAASGGWSGSEPTSGTAKLTAPDTAGSYSYILSCTGPGGGAAGTVTENVGTVPAPVVSLSVNPTSIQSGQSATLNWSATNADSCTAGGAWSGSEPASGSAGTGTLATDGTYSYTLTCTGPGGSGAGSATLTVSATPTPTLSLSASPTTVAVGGSTTLNWTSTNVSSCNAGGDWSGSQAVSGSQSEGPYSSAGVYSYTLTCGGGDGSAGSTVNVTVGSPAVPTISIAVSPTAVAPGQSATLTWSASNATACSASGSWSGDEPTSGSASTGDLATDGIYSYTLTCSGPAGSAAASAQLTVSGVSVIDACGIGQPSTILLAPEASTSVPAASGLCVGCSVSQPQNVTDADTSNYATINIVAGLLGGSQSLDVTSTASFPGGRTVGFTVANPDELLTLDLLQGLSLTTYLDGVATGDSACTSGGIGSVCAGTSGAPLNLLFLLGGTKQAFVSFKTTQAFNQVQLNDSVALLGLLPQLDVYDACVTNQ